MSNLRDPAEDDVVELVDNEGGLGIKYHLRQCVCGKYRWLVLVCVLVCLILVVTGVVLTLVLNKSKGMCHVNDILSQIHNAPVLLWLVISPN